MAHMDLPDSSFVSNPDSNIELWLASSILHKLLHLASYRISIFFLCVPFYAIQIFATFKASDLECFAICDEKIYILSYRNN